MDNSLENQLLEVWKDVIGYEGQYQVSSFGRLKALKRVIHRSDGTIQTFKEKIRKQYIQNSGYCMVGLNGENVQSRTIHSLMGEAFLDRDFRKCGLTVNHKNGIKTDNRLENLEICTRSENSQHGYDIKLNSNFGEGHIQSRLKNWQVLEIREKLANGVSAKEISDLYGIGHTYVYAIKNKGRWGRI